MHLLIVLVLVVNITIFMLDHFYLSHNEETRHLGVYIYTIYNAVVIGYVLYDYIFSQNIPQPLSEESTSLLNNNLLQGIISYIQSNPEVIKQLSKFLK
jgi:hypothetical protein